MTQNTYEPTQLSRLASMLFDESAPDKQAQALTLLEPARMSAALLAEAITCVHCLNPGQYGRSPCDNAEAVTYDGVKPEAGHYSKYAQFGITIDGFELNVFDGKNVRRAHFDIHASQQGYLSLHTQAERAVFRDNGNGGVLLALRDWVKASFDEPTRTAIMKKTRQLAVQKQNNHLNVPSSWASPFDRLRA